MPLRQQVTKGERDAGCLAMNMNKLILGTGLLAVLAGLLVAASSTAAAGGIVTLAVIFIGAFPITVMEEKRQGRTMTPRQMVVLAVGLLVAAVVVSYALLVTTG